MFKSTWLVLLLTAPCVTLVASLKIPSLAPGEVFVNASYMDKMKDLIPTFKSNTASANGGNPSPCPGCSVPPPDEDRIRIEIMKQKILYQLQMSEPPKRRSGKKLPTLLTQLKPTPASQQNTEPVDTDDQKIAKPVQYMVVGERVKSKRKRQVLFRFLVSSKIYNADISNANLWVHKNRGPDSSNQPRTLVVRDAFRKTQSQRRFRPRDNGWMDLKVTVMLNKWIQDDRIKSQGRSNKTYRHTIEIACKDCSRSLKESTSNVINCAEDRYRPMLIIDLKKSKSKRRKRSSPECVDGMKSCCLKRLYVEFRDLGWSEWIIAPNGFYANYCKGSCKGHARVKFHHTSVMQFIRNQNITQCCSPSHLSGLSMLYFDDNDMVTKKDLLNLTVEDCKCA